jgi:hypothetical protein
MDWKKIPSQLPSQAGGGLSILITPLSCAIISQFIFALISSKHEIILE